MKNASNCDSVKLNNINDFNKTHNIKRQPKSHKLYSNQSNNCCCHENSALTIIENCIKQREMTLQQSCSRSATYQIQISTDMYTKIVKVTHPMDVAYHSKEFDTYSQTYRICRCPFSICIWASGQKAHKTIITKLKSFELREKTPN